MTTDDVSMTLVPVTVDNYHAAMGLSVRPEQEQFVAPVVASLADAYAYREAEALLMLRDDEPTGFVLIYPWLEGEKRIVTIVRLLIDARFQSNGLGQVALELALDRSEARWPSVARFQLSVIPENIRALRFYQRAGFEETGETDDDGELILVLPRRGGSTRKTKRFQTRTDSSSDH